MNLTSWDQQFDKLADECDQLLDQQSRSRVGHDRAFTLRKISIMQEQDLLEEQIDRLRQLAGRDAFLLPREKALMHGARIFVDRITEYDCLRSDLLAQGLWFNLLKTRLLGKTVTRSQDFDNLASADIVALSVRQRSLTATENYLEARLVQLDQRRRDLMISYQQLDIEDANRCASVTYATRLGPDPVSASSSPLMTQLKFFLAAVKADSVARPGIHQRLLQQKERLEERTSGILALCRSFIFRCLKLASPAPKDRPLDQEILSIGRRLGRIDRLATRTAEELAAALTLPVDTAKTPIRVQKTLKTNKKKK
ncbi:MAG: hypothetical protein FJ146_03965 [Deltaproteobacteria bacterium]|nr:hypothetical protein [Deltaproteobacteria bacterium]